MRTLSVTLRSFFQKGRNNLIKVISLGVGLAMGLVLIAKVYLEQSYDNFYPDADRIYIIKSHADREDDESMEFTQVSGAIAPGMRMEVPGVEMATRYTWIAGDATFYGENRDKYKGDFVMGDTCLFDVFPRPILVGNWKEVLSRPMYVMISKKIAERMGGVTQVSGKTIELDSRPGKVFTIGGVFEDIPDNSHMNYSVVVSMASMPELYSWDGSMNWVGNDRYLGYVKLRPGVDPESLVPHMRRMQENNQPMEELKKAGIDLYYSLVPLRDIHSGSSEAKSMSRLLSLLAFAILFTAVMNYILIVISSLVRRAKEMAINKCYGASEGNIYGKMLMETFVHLLLSLILAVLLILLFRSQIYDLLGASLPTLFSWQACMILSLVCVVVFFTSAIVPGYLFARIPVSSAFRGYSETGRFWKLGLLFVQFIAAGFLITLVVIISRQYTYMIEDNPGYAYENLAYTSLVGVDNNSREMLIEELSRMPEVAAVSTCTTLPMRWASGNNIYLPNDERELFNISDNYFVGDGYFDLMEIPIIEGSAFREGSSGSTEVMVSRSFVEKMANFTDWSDGAIGKSIIITEHSQGGTQPFTICGVYENFRSGAIGREDKRPSVMFYNNNPSSVLLIKYHQQTPELNAKVEDKIQALLPAKDITLYSMPFELKGLYVDSERFRDSVLIGGIVALLISLIGLIGYTNDEMNRRKKEVAIRKVNGATLLDVEKLFLLDIQRIAIPALILAGGVAAYVATRWQEQFTEKVSLHPLLFLLCGIFVLLIIITVVIVNCYNTANENPAISVKSE